MTFLASGTVAIAAREREVVVAVGFEMTWLAPAANEHSATVWTGRTVADGFGLPISSLTLERELFEQACAQAKVALVHGGLNFS